MSKTIVQLLVIVLSSVASLSQTKTDSPVVDLDKQDFLREWGVKLFLDNDPAFKSSKYKERVKLASRQLSTISFLHDSKYQSKFGNLFDEYKYKFSKTDIHEPTIIRFASTGTEANNFLYEYAEYAYFFRTGKRAKRAHLLYFGQPYGGTFGRVAEIGIRYKANPDLASKLNIPTPYVSSMNPRLGPEEKILIERIEAEALRFIRRQVNNKQLEVGGIFLEPISISKGLFFFRSEFLLKLRSLADELKVPIMTDEVFTGGGRTGKFWAVSHYGLFRPDLFTFGKGLGLSGLAYYKYSGPFDRPTKSQWQWPSWENTQRKEVYTYPPDIVDNTSRIHPIVLIQALAILDRIQKDRLEDNARIVGEYAYKKILEKAKKLNIDGDIRGIGLLLHVGDLTDALVPSKQIKHFEGRWAPAITLSKSDFDRILQ